MQDASGFAMDIPERILHKSGFRKEKFCLVTMQQPQQLSSGSDSDPRYANMDEKKRKRMVSNRESARRSRMRKQQHLDEMLKEVNNLKTQNSEVAQKTDFVTQKYIAVESENNVLRAQIMELTDRLRSLNSVLEFMQDASGFAMDIPEIPDNLLEPWQIPCPVPNVFQC